MPKNELFVLVDKVAKVAANPMVFNTIEEADRYFEEVICKQPIPAARRNDFEWKRVGSFDRMTGVISLEGVN